jgi:hypothetical protein
MKWKFWIVAKVPEFRVRASARRFESRLQPALIGTWVSCPPEEGTTKKEKRKTRLAALSL